MWKLLLGAVLVLGAPAARAAPLTPDQLVSAEKKTYAGLEGDADAGKSFLITRGYLRECRKVVVGSLNPGKLEFEPDEFDPSYVSPEEQKVVDAAIKMNIASMLSRGKDS